jgi:hypothetical protein
VTFIPEDEIVTAAFAGRWLGHHAIRLVLRHTRVVVALDDEERPLQSCHAPISVELTS